MNGQHAIRVVSPAKVNLGLEILGRRDDGYHEIRSVLAMVEISDVLAFIPIDERSPSRISGMPDVPAATNLILKAIHEFNDVTMQDTAWQVDVTKRIPAPAGLGSASSNAASTLLALNHAAGQPLNRKDLSSIAARLGSDVPFFLGSPTALVTGTGINLSPVPGPRGWVLLCAPKVDIQAKTARLYSLLGPADFTDGRHAQEVVDSLVAGEMPAHHTLSNAFSHPLEGLVPMIGQLREDMRSAGIDTPLLTGAGPAHYAVFLNESSALEAREQLAGITNLDVVLHVAPFRDRPLAVETTPQ